MPEFRVFESHSLDRLQNELVGASISRFQLIMYVSPDGIVDRDDVQLQIICGNGNFLHLGTWTDGERLKLFSSPWSDSFDAPLSEENRKYVEEHGEWKLSDSSSYPEYAFIIGQTINGISPLKNKFGTLAGLQISCDEATILYCVDCDTGQLFVEKQAPTSLPLGFQRVTQASTEVC